MAGLGRTFEDAQAWAIPFMGVEAQGYVSRERQLV